MRYDAEHKKRTRQRVLSEAALAIRRYGPGGIGVADLMAKAGLTHGGFYAHFKSKDELVAEAITEMFDERYEAFWSRADADPAKALEQFINGYLSRTHCAEPERGCPLPSLSGELARLPPGARKRFQAGTERLLHWLAERLRALEQPAPGALAASMLAEMAGALALARAVAEPALSEHILKSSRDAIKRRAGLRRSPK